MNAMAMKLIWTVAGRALDVTSVKLVTLRSMSSIGSKITGSSCFPDSRLVQVVVVMVGSVVVGVGSSKKSVALLPLVVVFFSGSFLFGIFWLAMLSPSQVMGRLVSAVEWMQA